MYKILLVVLLLQQYLLLVDLKLMVIHLEVQHIVIIGLLIHLKYLQVMKNIMHKVVKQQLIEQSHLIKMEMNHLNIMG